MVVEVTKHGVISWNESLTVNTRSWLNSYGGPNLVSAASIAKHGNTLPLESKTKAAQPIHAGLN